MDYGFHNDLCPHGLVLKPAGIAPTALEQLFAQYIPFQSAGMGWVSFAVLGFVVGLIHKGLASDNK